MKFFMKVNVYDPDNVQKGKLILLNIAEDLKQYAKVKVRPGTQGKVMRKHDFPKGSKKDDVDVPAEAYKQAFVNLKSMGGDGTDDLVADEDFDEDASQMPDYLYMELESTVYNIK